MSCNVLCLVDFDMGCRPHMTDSSVVHRHLGVALAVEPIVARSLKLLLARSELYRRESEQSVPTAGTGLPNRLCAAFTTEGVRPTSSLTAAEGGL